MTKLDTTYKNLKIQKKYLENINSLLKFKSYQNPQMEFNRAKVRKLIKQIENIRFKVNKYALIVNFFDFLELLNINCNNDIYGEIMNDKIDHKRFVSMFGEESIGLNMTISL